VDGLRLRITGDERKRLAKRPTINPDAYQLYLRGRFYLNKRTPDGLKSAFDLFQEAVARDSAFALAHAGLADAYLLAGSGYVSLPLSDVIPKASEAARRALEIDPSLAEAHASLGFLKFRFEWDWAGAERAFRRALELSPGSSQARHWFALFLASRSRFDEALAEMRRARELDPLSLVMLAGIARILHFAGRYPEALEIQRQALQMDPSFLPGRFDIGMTLVAMGRYRDAADEFQVAADASGMSSIVLLARGMVAALEGRTAEAREYYTKLEAENKKAGRSVDELAILSMQLGEKDKAYEWLKLACQQHASILAYINVEPVVAPLRNDPRCHALLASYGLVPPASPTAGS
jgi:serine/threonine-protein kinase